MKYSRRQFAIAAMHASGPWYARAYWWLRARIGV